MSQELPENETEINVLSVACHAESFGSEDEPQDIILNTQDPFIVVRPCEEDGTDLCFDLLQSQMPADVAISMLTMAANMLREEQMAAQEKAVAAVNRLLGDVLGTSPTLKDGAE